MIIAISRQRGSGGAEVGRRVADQLKLRYVDRQLLRHAAEFLQARDDQAGAAPAAGSWWARLGEAMGIGSGGFTHAPPALESLQEHQLLGIEQRLLGEIADHGDAVIVGCGAAQALKGRPGVLSVFLHAPAAWRITRVQQVYGIDRTAAEQAVRESDRNRARFIEQLTGAPWTHAGSHHVSVDTSLLGVDGAVALVLAAAEEVKSEK